MVLKTSHDYLTVAHWMQTDYNIINIKFWPSECYDNDATALKTNNGSQKLVLSNSADKVLRILLEFWNY